MIDKECDKIRMSAMLRVDQNSNPKHIKRTNSAYVLLDQLKEMILKNYNREEAQIYR